MVFLLCGGFFYDFIFFGEADTLWRGFGLGTSISRFAPRLPSRRRQVLPALQVHPSHIVIHSEKSPRPTHLTAAACAHLLWQVVPVRRALGLVLPITPHLDAEHLLPLIVVRVIEARGRLLRGYPVLYRVVVSSALLAGGATPTVSLPRRGTSGVRAVAMSGWLLVGKHVCRAGPEANLPHELGIRLIEQVAFQEHFSPTLKGVLGVESETLI